MSEIVGFGTPAAPGNAATIDLFNSVTAFGAKSMRQHGLTLLEFGWLQNNQASATNGVRFYVSTDGGLTWLEDDRKNAAAAATIGTAAPITVPILAAGQGYPVRIFVGDCPDVKVTYTAGATGPTLWELFITGHFKAVAVAR